MPGGNKSHAGFSFSPHQSSLNFLPSLSAPYNKTTNWLLSSTQQFRYILWHGWTSVWAQGRIHQTVLLWAKFDISCPALLRMTPLTCPSQGSEPSPWGAMSLNAEMCSGYETVSANTSILLALGMNVLPKGQLLSWLYFPESYEEKQTNQPTTKAISWLSQPLWLVLSGCFLLSLPLGNKLKLCVYFCNTEKHKEKASQKDDPVSHSRDLPTTTWKGKINLKALHYVIDLPFNMTYNSVSVLNSLKVWPSSTP